MKEKKKTESRNDRRLRRLSQLKYMLENHSKLFRTVKFDMNIWCEMNGEEEIDIDKANAKELQIPKSCGTAACALGSAGLFTPFREQGLKTNPIWNEVNYRGKEGMDAGASFFGITMDESCDLFDPNNYTQQRITPKTVLKRVEKLIEQYS